MADQPEPSPTEPTPPTRRQVKIDLQGGTGRIEIDNNPISGIYALHLDATVGKVPHLTLDLALLKQTINGEMTAAIPEGTKTTLMQLGWTPPNETTT